MNNLVLFILFVLFLYILLLNKYKSPTQQEIQTLSYLGKEKEIEDFPYPQISRPFKQLSNGTLPKPLNNEEEMGLEHLRIVRTNVSEADMSKKRVYLPDYYRKDRLEGNPEGTEEYRKIINDNNIPDTSWDDVNVSEHPKFYNSMIQNELTNIGSFFDSNNQYHDKLSSNTNTIHSDSCFVDKKGDVHCDDNSRLQIIPPKLITDYKQCYFLNSIGDYKNKKYDNKEENDDIIYGNVTGYYKDYEKNDEPMNDLVSSCEI